MATVVVYAELYSNSIKFSSDGVNYVTNLTVNAKRGDTIAFTCTAGSTAYKFEYYSGGSFTLLWGGTATSFVWDPVSSNPYNKTVNVNANVGVTYTMKATRYLYTSPSAFLSIYVQPADYIPDDIAGSLDDDFSGAKVNTEYELGQITVDGWDDNTNDKIYVDPGNFKSILWKEITGSTWNTTTNATWYSVPSPGDTYEFKGVTSDDYDTACTFTFKISGYGTSTSTYKKEDSITVTTRAAPPAAAVYPEFLHTTGSIPMSDIIEFYQGYDVEDQQWVVDTNLDAYRVGTLIPAETANADINTSAGTYISFSDFRDTVAKMEITGVTESTKTVPTNMTTTTANGITFRNGGEGAVNGQGLLQWYETAGTTTYWGADVDPSAVNDWEGDLSSNPFRIRPGELFEYYYYDDSSMGYTATLNYDSNGDAGDFLTDTASDTLSVGDTAQITFKSTLPMVDYDNFYEHTITINGQSATSYFAIGNPPVIAGLDPLGTLVFTGMRFKQEGKSASDPYKICPGDEFGMRFLNLVPGGTNGSATMVWNSEGDASTYWESTSNSTATYTDNTVTNTLKSTVSAGTTFYHDVTVTDGTSTSTFTCYYEVVSSAETDSKTISMVPYSYSGTYLYGFSQGTYTYSTINDDSFTHKDTGVSTHTINTVRWYADDSVGGNTVPTIYLRIDGYAENSGFDSLLIGNATLNRTDADWFGSGVTYSSWKWIVDTNPFTVSTKTDTITWSDADFTQGHGGAVGLFGDYIVTSAAVTYPYHNDILYGSIVNDPAITSSSPTTTPVCFADGDSLAFGVEVTAGHGTDGEVSGYVTLNLTHHVDTDTTLSKEFPFKFTFTDQVKL